MGCVVKAETAPAVLVAQSKVAGAQGTGTKVIQWALTDVQGTGRV